MSSKTVLDPVKAREQFDKDLAAMKVGPRESIDAKQRPLTKDFGLATFKANRWRCNLGEGQTIQDARDPAFWTNQADEIMRPDHKGRGDIIEVWKADTCELAELLVVEVGKGYVRTVLLREASVSEVLIPDDSTLTTKWNPGLKTHQVARKADGVIVHQAGFQTKASALAWISDHIAKVAA